MDTRNNQVTVRPNPSTLTRRGVLQAGALAGGSMFLAQRAHAQSTTAPQPELEPAHAAHTGHNRLTTPTAAPNEHGNLGPGESGADYTPVLVPNGWTLPYKLVGGVKVFHLVAEEVEHEFADGLKATCWGYNGSVHGPVIEACEGDRVRIFMTNKLKALTATHWHGLLLPSGMDGVGGLTQRAIKPGETFMYEFTLRQHGTCMYHAHHDEMTQMGMGMTGLFIIHPRTKPSERPDRDYALMLHEWALAVGASRPDPNEMSDFNILTINGKCFPATQPLVAQVGERVRIRIGNLSAMDHHSIHLHGYYWLVTETDGGVIPPAGRWPETTVLVPVGSTRTVELLADNPGDWALHCHMTHHVMTQMGHNLPNTIGVDARGLDNQVRKLLPDYMTMGQDGMAGMTEMGMNMPPNSLPMVGGVGPYDEITMGGMFTIFKVRESVSRDVIDPGWYAPPVGTLALPATDESLRLAGVAGDGSSAPMPPEGVLRPHRQAPPLMAHQPSDGPVEHQHGSNP